GKGKVLGVDIKPIAPLGDDNVHFILGDVTSPELVEQILKYFNGKIDVVISDLSPNITGTWEVDHARQIDLAQHALTISKLTLKDNGIFFTKIFDGPYMKEFLNQVKTCFEDVKIVKPKASRPESSELYVLARKFRSTP
ncbi:MAG: FtsJ-like methyltransferase family protein, partial [Candidatus Bathyarchaeia archaeon]